MSIKVLKNTTPSPVALSELGLSIPASGQITLASVDYLKLAGADSLTALDALITAGTVVVNDGASDLTIARGQQFIRHPHASENILFDPAGTAYLAETRTVKEALVELRARTITVPQSTASTVSGTLTLTVSSNTFQRITGTATGYSVRLPNATTLQVGQVFQIFNKSSQNVTVRDSTTASLFVLNAFDFSTVRLEANATAAGSWIINITSSAATGILSYFVTSGTTFSTSSSSDTIITGFSVTPGSGVYALFLSADINIGSNNRIADCVAYVGGTANENTRRKLQGAGNNYRGTITSIGQVTVNGAQSVDIRVNISSGSVDIRQRSLILIRVGAL